MTPPPALRATTRADAEAVNALLAASYPQLLAADYAGDVLARALPFMTRAKPELLDSGRYFMIEGAGGAAMASGGWSHGAPGTGLQEAGVGHVRQVACHPGHLRQGHSARILSQILTTARDAGLGELECLSTLSAVTFYARQGFVEIEPLDVMIGGQAPFPSVRMRCLL